jgi:hypothetical protein
MPERVVQLQHSFRRLMLAIALLFACGFAVAVYVFIANGHRIAEIRRLAKQDARTVLEVKALSSANALTLRRLKAVSMANATAREGVCALRRDLIARAQADKHRVKESELFLRKHPHGIDGISAALIRSGIASQRQALRNEQRAVRALDIVRCQPPTR